MQDLAEGRARPLLVLFCRFRGVAILVLGMMLVSCSGHDETWELHLLDAEGRITATAELQLSANRTIGKDFEGSLKLINVSPDFQYAGACGTLYSATIRADEVIANLNYGTADNNVTLNGRPDGAGFAGNWHFCSAAGATTMGRFELKKTGR